MKYERQVYDDVKDFYSENYDQFLSDDNIDDMPRSEVLSAWLRWNGIYGYTITILNILDYND